MKKYFKFLYHGGKLFENAKFVIVVLLFLIVLISLIWALIELPFL